MTAFLQQEYPPALPRQRIEVAGDSPPVHNAREHEEEHSFAEANESVMTEGGISLVPDRREKWLVE
jgi:hypothetical protein